MSHVTATATATATAAAAAATTTTEEDKKVSLKRDASCIGDPEQPPKPDETLLDVAERIDPGTGDLIGRLVVANEEVAAATMQERRWQPIDSHGNTLVLPTCSIGKVVNYHVEFSACSTDKLPAGVGACAEMRRAGQDRGSVTQLQHGRLLIMVADGHSSFDVEPGKPRTAAVAFSAVHMIPEMFVSIWDGSDDDAEKMLPRAFARFATHLENENKLAQATGTASRYSTDAACVIAVFVCPGFAVTCSVGDCACISVNRQGTLEHLARRHNIASDRDEVARLVRLGYSEAVLLARQQIALDGSYINPDKAIDPTADLALPSEQWTYGLAPTRSFNDAKFYGCVSDPTVSKFTRAEGLCGIIVASDAITDSCSLPTDVRSSTGSVITAMIPGDRMGHIARFINPKYTVAETAALLAITAQKEVPAIHYPSLDDSTVFYVDMSAFTASLHRPRPQRQ